MVDVLRSFAMKTHQRAMCACVCAPFEINVQRIVADATVDPCICFENPPLFSALQKHGRRRRHLSRSLWDIACKVDFSFVHSISNPKRNGPHIGMKIEFQCVR